MRLNARYLYDILTLIRITVNAPDSLETPAITLYVNSYPIGEA